MERVVDKAIVFACCLACFAMLPWELALLLALLCALAATALAEVLPRHFSSLPALAFALAALAQPAFSVFLPVAVYDLARDERLAVRACWTLPLLSAFVRLEWTVALLVALVCAVSLLLSFRTRHAHAELAAYRRLRDSVQETSLALEEKNRDLQERQDLEVRLATLAERGRIAREIHDNVGHLLTRSIMQVEALQVVHRNDEQVCAELSQVGDTLHEAMSTVRASVHDLHDDAFDLETQIGQAASACTVFTVDVDYRASEVPAEVGYCFIAIVREALSNVAKHTDASRVSVSVAAYPAFYRLVVHDNGSTSPPADVLGRAGGEAGESVVAGRGIGLATMADRARALGGMLRVDYDKGFKVFVTIPRKDCA